MTTKIQGQLEIDHKRGVIYFHTELGNTLLRICQLPEIPQAISREPVRDALLDITHMHGTNWSKEDIKPSHCDRCCTTECRQGDH